MSGNNDLISELENGNNWVVKIGNANMLFNIEAVKQIKHFARITPELEIFNQFSAGHVPKYKLKQLSQEFMKVLEQGSNTVKFHDDVFKLCAVLITAAEYYEKTIKMGDIDSYMKSGDIWMLPAHARNYNESNARARLYNLDLYIDEHNEILDGRLYYDILRDYGVIPNLSDDDGLLSFSKSKFDNRWRNVPRLNKGVSSKLLKVICNETEEEMVNKQYDDKYTLNFCYIKYSPSKEVIDKVIENFKKHMDKELLKDLVMILWPSQYKGYQIDREVFNNEDYAFTNKKIVINFEDLSVSYEDLQKDDFKVFL